MIPKSFDPADVRPTSLQGPPTSLSTAQRGAIRRRLIGLVIVGGVTILGFGGVIWDLAQFSLSSDFFSYIPLIPVVSLYLIWIKRRSLHLESEPVRRYALLPLAAALLLLGAYRWAERGGWSPALGDQLAILVGTLLSFLFAGCCFFLGPRTLRAIGFPAAFLIFAAPLPGAAYEAIEAFLQRASADVAYVFILATGTPVTRDGLIFRLSDIAIRVAPECSGIHSTFVLLITSVLAAYLFLRKPSRQILLVAAVLPLALLRNGFRIWVISELCVHIGPQMINAYIHRHGGPIFFAASLIPFYFWLRFLCRSESARTPAPSPKPAG